MDEIGMLRDSDSAKSGDMTRREIGNRDVTLLCVYKSCTQLLPFVWWRRVGQCFRALLMSCCRTIEIVSPHAIVAPQELARRKNQCPKWFRHN